MSRYGALLGFVTWLAVLTLLLDIGCSRPNELNGTQGTAATDPHQVPFPETDGKGSADSTAAPVSGVSDKSAKAEPGLPFRDPDNLLAGTLLTVRLKNSVSADSPQSNGRFEGILDEPVTVDGNILVPSGASVAGRVEWVHSSKANGSGFVRVTLDSIDIAGKDLHLQTSSLFARGNGASQSPAGGAITLEKGRRLTFRLTESSNLAPPPSSSR